MVCSVNIQFAIQHIVLSYIIPCRYPDCLLNSRLPLSIVCAAILTTIPYPPILPALNSLMGSLIWRGFP